MLPITLNRLWPPQITARRAHNRNMKSLLSDIKSDLQIITDNTIIFSIYENGTSLWRKIGWHVDH